MSDPEDEDEQRPCERTDPKPGCDPQRSGHVAQPPVRHKGSDTGPPERTSRRWDEIDDSGQRHAAGRLLTHARLERRESRLAAAMKRPSRILYVHHRTELGGAPASLSGLIAALDRTVFEPYVYCPGGPAGQLFEEA